MPKLYLYLDPQAGDARRSSLLEHILPTLQPLVRPAQPTQTVQAAKTAQAAQKVQASKTVKPESASQEWGTTSSDSLDFQQAVLNYEQGITTLSPVGTLDDWDLVFLDASAYADLLANMKDAAKFKAKHGNELANSKYAALTSDDVLISFEAHGAGLTLLREGKLKPLCLDFEQVAYRQRLLRGGRQKEAVSRAVLQGINDGDLIFDATAGLGRESMILAHAGGHVLSFERQVPIWIILADALERAQHSRFFPFTLPTLHRLGTIKDYTGNTKPEVVYYDPMFPERESSAQVKKDMFIFQQVIGHDTDTEDFLRFALTLATKRVVVKRPSFAPAVEAADLKCAYSVDGGQCRFDCYTVD